MPYNPNSSTARRGADFELAMRRELEARGNLVMPLYAMHEGHDKAPLATGKFAGYRAPDLLVSTKGRGSILLECKRKFRAATYRAQWQDRQGINLPCYRDYLDIERRFNLPVWLSIGDDTKRAVYIARLRNLSMQPYHGKNPCPDGMAYFPFDEFKYWGPWNPNTNQLSLHFRGGGVGT